MAVITVHSIKPYQVTIETERLIIRQYVQDDIAHSISLFGDPDNMVLYMQGVAFTEEQTLARVQKLGPALFAEGSPFGLYTVFLKDATFVGHLDIWEEANDIREMSIVIDKKYQSAGLGTEFVSTLYHYSYFLRKHGYNINAILVTAHPDNVRSWKAIERIGFFTQKEKTMKYGQPRLRYVGWLQPPAKL